MYINNLLGLKDTIFRVFRVTTTGTRIVSPDNSKENPAVEVKSTAL
jgi:hypothetical protein